MERFFKFSKTKPIAVAVRDLDEKAKQVSKLCFEFSKKYGGNPKKIKSNLGFSFEFSILIENPDKSRWKHPNKKETESWVPKASGPSKKEGLYQEWLDICQQYPTRDQYSSLIGLDFFQHCGVVIKNDDSVILIVDSKWKINKDCKTQGREISNIQFEKETSVKKKPVKSRSKHG